MTTEEAVKEYLEYLHRNWPDHCQRDRNLASWGYEAGWKDAKEDALNDAKDKSRAKT